MADQPPSLRFLLAHPAHFIALGCGSGLSRWAPGTVGTAFALFTYPLLRPWFGEQQFMLLLAFAYLAGIWCVELTGRRLGVVDHGSIVWDEIVPFWGVLALLPDDWRWHGAAFLLFRLFDIIKLPPADWFDQQVKNGFGVMADDLMAALHTLVALGIIRWFL